MYGSIFKDDMKLKEILQSYKPSQILYASIDVAKYNHCAMVVNFFGDVIVPRFDFPYNNHGIDFFHKKLLKAKKQTNAKKIFIGVESTGHYHENLVLRLEHLGDDVQIIRPIDSKNERDNVHAKTDDIDLAAIVKVIMSNKGPRSHIPNTIYYNLQRASRTHRQLTCQETRQKNIITMLLDKTFNGLWNPNNSIFSDKWGKASLLFVSHYPTPQQALRIGAKRLASFFSKHNTKLGIDTANKIIALARITPAKPLEMTESDVKALKSHLKVLDTLMSTVLDQKKQMLKFLLQTPGTYLLSIPGISIVYASDFTAEIEDIHRFAYAKQIISLAGTSPKKHQSGLLDKSNLPTSHRGKNPLRMTVNQIALSLNAHCLDFHHYYSKKHFQYQDASPKAKTATANKFIKLAFALMKNESLYYPKTRNPLLSDKEYYQSVWNNIILKVSPYLSDDIPLDNYLSHIQHHLKVNYDIIT